MADKKKLTDEEIKNEELTDEQANEAAGGAHAGDSLHSYRCAGCGRTRFGSPFRVDGKTYCVNCVPNTTKL